MQKGRKLMIVTFDSQTAAIGAKRALKRDGISSRVVDVDPRVTRRGCTYGVEIAGDVSAVALERLDARKIEYSAVLL